jgi:hypothetical protein
LSEASTFKVWGDPVLPRGEIVDLALLGDLTRG